MRTSLSILLVTLAASCNPANSAARGGGSGYQRPRPQVVTRIHRDWMFNTSLRYCGAPVVTNHRVTGRPPREHFGWNIRCPGNRRFTCTGTSVVSRGISPSSSGPGLVATPSIEGRCHELGVKTASARPEKTTKNKLGRDEVLAVLASAHAEALACYEAGDAPPPAKAAVVIQIAGDGSCIYMGAQPSPEAKVAGCLRQLYQGLKFRASGGDPIKVRTPALRFEQREPESAHEETAQPASTTNSTAPDSESTQSHQSEPSHD